MSKHSGLACPRTILAGVQESSIVLKQDKRGFTLVELLVVIAVIALLMAILIPALTKAKEQARSIVCRSNLKQWGIICAAYADNNNGFLWSGRDNDGFYWLGKLSVKERDYKNNKIWFCPNARKPRFLEDGVTLSGEKNVFGAWGVEWIPGPEGVDVPVAGSFGINGYLLNTRNPNSSLGGSTPDNWRSINVKGASEIPMFLDSLRYDGWPEADDGPAPNEDAAWTFATNNHMARFCINRHKGAVSCIFADMHVRKVALKELWTLKWHRRFRTNGMYTKAGGATAATWAPYPWIASFPDY